MVSLPGRPRNAEGDRLAPGLGFAVNKAVENMLVNCGGFSYFYTTFFSNGVFYYCSFLFR